MVKICGITTGQIMIIECRLSIFALCSYAAIAFVNKSFGILSLCSVYTVNMSLTPTFLKMKLLSGQLLKYNTASITKIHSLVE